MVPQQNKRKASTSPSPPTTPRATAPHATGAHFFLPSFASPKTMPKKTTTPFLEYLYSPTPAASPTALLPRDDPSKKCTSLPEVPSLSLEGDDMDLSDSHVTQGGLNDSMHAPPRNAPQTPTGRPAPQPVGQMATQATNVNASQTPSLGLGQGTGGQNEASPIAAAPPTPQEEVPALPKGKELPPPQSVNHSTNLIDTLSAIAESSANMISVSSTGFGDESYFTPTPANDFPITYRGIPGEFLIGLNPETVTAWCAVPAPKFFIRIFDYDGSNARARHATLSGLVRIAIQEIAKTRGYDDTDVRIAPPTAPPVPTIHPLITFLVHDVTQETTAAILQQRVWSSSEVTFEAFPFDTETIPSLTLCLNGFTSPDETAVRNAVLGAWSAAAPITRMMDLLQKLDPAFEGLARRHDTREAIASMVLSARAELVDFKEPGGVPSPRFNIFTKSPTTELKAWSEIKKLLFTITCPSLLIGTGHPTRTFYCHICHSLTHPRGLCPFPLIPGWKGPKYSQERAPPPRGRGRGRGGRSWQGRRGTPL